MKKLCCERDEEAARARMSVLEAAGLVCELREDRGAPLFDGRESPPAPYGVWVADGDFERAWRLLNAPSPAANVEAAADSDD